MRGGRYDAEKRRSLINRGMAVLLSGALVFGCITPMGASVSRAESKDENKTALSKDVSALKFRSEQVTSNLTLPEWGENGSSISWTSSQEDAISTDGTVTRPAAGQPDAQVTLEATVSMGDLQYKKKFDLKVLAESSMQDLSQFNLDDVEITDSYYLAAQQSDIEFLKKFDNDRLLSRFRETAGVDTKGIKPYKGWEDSLLGGHSVGH